MAKLTRFIMEFYPDQPFHIYNQGNNKRQVFFSDENYRYFIWKMRAYLLPFGDIVAWCLMPNHFHWLFYVRRVQVPKVLLYENVDHTEWKRRQCKYGPKAIRPHVRRPGKATQTDQITLNDAIGILQQSYAQAVNKERNYSGVLFRPKCKAKDGWIDEFITIANQNGALFKRGSGYFYNCFCYIHNNPVEAKMVKSSIHWAYSSARDYANLRKGTLCNLKMGRNLIAYL